MCRQVQSTPKATSVRKGTFSLLLLVLCLVLWAGPGWAHKVTIFAWVEGDTVHTQSKFSGGKRPKNSTVVVYDMDENLLLEGKTDEKGEFSFKIPKRTALKVALKASMGHLAEWTIPVEEIKGVAGSMEASAPEEDVEAAAQEAASLTDVTGRAEVQEPTAAGLSRREVQELIDASLDKKLTPIVNMLAESLDRGPTVSEVMGGIGYIFGLVGVALYFLDRGKRK